jgi:hypothetical protein
LRGNGAPPRGFEFGQAGLKNALGRDIVLDQFFDARGAQSLSRGEREPVGRLRSGIGAGNDYSRQIGHTASRLPRKTLSRMARASLLVEFVK